VVVRVWYEDGTFDWRQLEPSIRKIALNACNRSPLSTSIPADQLAKYAFWIVYADLQGRLDAYVQKKLHAKYGNPQQDVRERAQKIDTLAKNVERTLLLNPFWPIPPFGIPEQLRAYSKQLRGYAASPSKYQRRKKWSDRSTEMLEKLVQRVTQETGRPHHEEITDILTKTAAVLGAKTEIPGRVGQSRLVYDVATLKMRLRRAQARRA
jgi:hypothetical protein